MNQRPYAGNARPFVYAQFAPQDRESAETVLTVVRERGYEVWPSEKSDERRMEKSALALFFLSPDAAASEETNRSISRAAQRNLPLLVVYLSPTELTPAQQLLLNTQQAMARSEHGSDEAFFKKLFGSGMLQKLQATRAQKRAARLTIWGIIGGVLAAAALAVALALGVNAKIPEDSLLAQLGYSGSMADIRQIYLYGRQTSNTRAITSYYNTVFDSDVQKWKGIVLTNEDNLNDAGEINDLSDFVQLKNLEELAIAGNQVADISPLFQLHRLRYLDITGNPVSDLSGIGSLDMLETLRIANTLVQSLQPLDECRNLSAVYVDVGQYAVFSADGAAHGYQLIVVGPVEDMRHLDTHIFGGIEEFQEDDALYCVFIRTMSWTIYDDYTYEVLKNGVPVRIIEIKRVAQFGGPDDMVHLWLNPVDFGRYDTNAEYLLTVRYGGKSVTYSIGHKYDTERKNALQPVLVDSSGF